MTLCPNCGGTLAANPDRCSSCGYRPELAREYLWRYAGGGAIVVAGFAAGAAGVWIEGAGPGHWSRAHPGLFPLAPCPPGFEWLALVVAGIALTGSGLALTRARNSAWVLLAAALAGEAAWAIRVLAAARGAPSAAWAATGALSLEVLLLVLLARIRLAIRRAPRTEFSVRQGAGRNPESPP
jgi:hypothetical protein